MQYAEECLERKKLGVDEELQMVACAYADLVLKAANQGDLDDLGASHTLISKCLTKIKEDRLGKRHFKLAQAYFNIARDPNWTPPSK